MKGDMSLPTIQQGHRKVVQIKQGQVTRPVSAAGAELTGGGL
jgi:hypothetical protein